MADGSIRIETKLDNSALKQQIKELERELKNIQKEQAKVDAQMDGAMAKYQAEKDFDSQFPEEFSHREDIDKRAAQELDPIIAKQEELNQKEQQYLAMLDAAKAKLAEQANIASASKQVDSEVKADSSMGKVQSQADYNSLLDATAAKMATIEAAAGRVAAQTGLSKEQILAANPAYQKLSDTMGMLKAKSADFGKEAQAAGKKASKAMKNAEKSTKKVGSATRNGIAGFGKMQLMMMGIMMAMRAISAATQEYMAVNTHLEGQMNTLKALWGQVLGPVIEWFINLIIRAITAVNALVQALTGINFVARANEAALNKQARAASGAAKAAQLAGFDEQTKLNDTSGGGNDPVAILDASMDNLPAFIERMREQLLAGDWYGAGETLGQALMDGMESTDWQSIGTKIGEVLGGAVSFALGFALSLDPITMLESLVELVSGLMDGLSTTIQEMDWAKIGGDLVELLIKGLIVSLITTNPFATLIALIFTPQGKELTSSAAELVGSIIGALLSAIVGAAQRIGEIGIEIWNTIKGYFDEYVDWEGTPGDIIEGLFNGIIDALKGVGDWIYNNIWVPFRDGFKEAFDIHSPSKKMSEFGVNIIDGLCKGIKDSIYKVKQACIDIWTAIKEKFANVGTWFKEKFSDAWTKVKDVFSEKGTIFDGIKEGISETFKTIVNKLIDGINKVIAVPFNSINRMLNTIRGVEVLGVSPFSGLWSYNPLSVPQIPKLALGGIVNRPGRGVPAIIGEAGAEAVLPLENNTEWMDILADKIGGGTITIPINLDGKRIATYVVDIQKKKAFAMNGA